MQPMAIDPRSTSEISDSIKSNVKGKIAKLTNFLPESFNMTWINSYSEEIHEAEVKVLVAQLSAFPDYSGNTNLDETDLEKLGITDVDPEEVNDLMKESHLEELAKLVGVSRDQGQKATGKATILTATDDTRVPEGMEVATSQQPDGSYQSYYVDADGDGTIGETGYTTPATGETEVQVDIIAAEIGGEYNTGSGSISRLPDPPVGVEGIKSNTEVSGGQDIQPIDEFRNDVQSAVFEASGGGTTRGIVGYVSENAQGVNDVELDEFLNQQPPFVDVIVDGGSDSDVKTAIDNSRPTGIRHNLVRPETVGLGVRTEVIGSDIDTSFVSSQISEYLTTLTLGEEFRRSRTTQRIMNADNDIEDIGSLTALIESVSNESKVYSSGTTVYDLDFAPVGSVEDDELLFDSNKSVYTLSYTQMADADVTVTGIVNGSEYTFVEGTDYEVIDDDGDGNNDSIDFSIGGTNPDDRTAIEAEYTHSSWAINSTITDENDNSYTKGTDWDIVDTDSDGLMDSIDWSVGGSSPADGVRWFVNYEPKRTASRDLDTTKREKVSEGQTLQVNTFQPSE